MNVRDASLPEAHSHPPSNDRSTVDAVEGDLRTNGHFFQYSFVTLHERLGSVGQ